MKRTVIKDLPQYLNQEVKVSGFVNARRDHGKLIFLDLRDQSGKIQMVSQPQNKKAYELADQLRPEWVAEVVGKVNKRPEKMINEAEANGHLELEISEIKILSKAETPPFDIYGEGKEINEEMRMKFRYLDLRRPRMQKNLQARHKVIKFLRDYLDSRGFLEVETPILTKSTPEGARDYVVPSRIDIGKFYALPQSPQQYKQLLMVGGVEKYFQIARCIRDEDTRGDRQPEFTQLDIELSFVSQEEILALIEQMYTEIVHALYPNKRITRTPWPRIKFKEAQEKFSSDKPDLRKDKNDPDELAFVWVLDFPLFEEEKENGFFAPSHHMFTAPKEEDLDKLDTDPALVLSYQHDLVLNGSEIGGGSLRITKPEIQKKIFDLIGFKREEKAYFEHMLKAFSYGAPPHGGIACGLDRLLAILEKEPSIREVIAFPKTGEGRDLLMDAPSGIREEQLKELGIVIKNKGSDEK